MDSNTKTLFCFERDVYATSEDFMDKLNGLIDKYKVRERYDYIQGELTDDILEIFPVSGKAFFTPQPLKGDDCVSKEAFEDALQVHLYETVDSAIFRFAYEYVISRVFAYWNDFNNYLKDYDPIEQ